MLSPLIVMEFANIHTQIFAQLMQKRSKLEYSLGFGASFLVANNLDAILNS